MFFQKSVKHFLFADVDFLYSQRSIEKNIFVSTFHASVFSKEENKRFEVTFASLGSDTCMVIDFNDGTVKSYGDASYCKEWKPDVKYDPTFEFLTSPQPLTYIY